MTSSPGPGLPACGVLPLSPLATRVLSLGRPDEVV